MADIAMPAGTPAITPTTTTTDAAAKDTHTGASTLSSSVLTLLTAVADLIDLPIPDGSEAAERAYHRALERRSWSAVSVLRVVVEQKGTLGDWGIEHLAATADRHPVTYPPHVRAGGEQR